MADERFDDLHRRIGLGMRIGALRALRHHKQAGVGIAIWQDERVVRIPPEEIEVDEALLAELEAEAARLTAVPR